jgi:hypothetical protein
MRGGFFVFGGESSGLRGRLKNLKNAGNAERYALYSALRYKGENKDG